MYGLGLEAEWAFLKITAINDNSIENFDKPIVIILFNLFLLGAESWRQVTGLNRTFICLVCMCVCVNKCPSSEDRVYVAGLFSIQYMLIICVEKSS